MSVSLCCPKCKTSLDVSNKSLRCNKCDVNWPYMDDIPNFLSHNGHWEILSEDDMKSLLEVAEKESCENALAKVLLPKTAEHIYKYYTDPTHYGYLKLFPQINDAKVLDFGCSLGNITLELAQKYSEVVAVDTARYSLKFLKLWASQKKLTNIRKVLIDPIEFSGLPFANNSFDVINFNLVLQWVGVQNKDVNPKKSQIFCLKELHRVLKATGIIYFGVINRYWYKFFFGESDGSTVPYTSILPRFISNFWVSQYKKTKNYSLKKIFLFNFAKKSADISENQYRNYTYSINAFLKMLKQTGFKKVMSLIPLPNPRFIQYILKYNDSKINIYMRKLILNTLEKEKNEFKKLFLKLFFSIVDKLKLYKYFVHGFSIFAKK